MQHSITTRVSALATLALVCTSTANAQVMAPGGMGGMPPGGMPPGGMGGMPPGGMGGMPPGGMGGMPPGGMGGMPPGGMGGMPPGGMGINNAAPPPSQGFPPVNDAAMPYRHWNSAPASTTPGLGHTLSAATVVFVGLAALAY
ncbi:MAG: hypothetical protein DHS80DRAFT_23690 [Piptocephalis tieghemiana]|nr:MAG: hypothetical protein DHS80DRAFT_23690 [Piptocephalis tieghemiana]